MIIFKYNIYHLNYPAKITYNNNSYKSAYELYIKLFRKDSCNATYFSNIDIPDDSKIKVLNYINYLKFSQNKMLKSIIMSEIESDFLYECPIDHEIGGGIIDGVQVGQNMYGNAVKFAKEILDMENRESSDKIIEELRINVESICQ